MNDAIVHISNQSSRDIFISGDPNWDDQVLVYNGRPGNSLHRLAAGHAAQLAVSADRDGTIDEYALGLIMADGRDVDYGSAGAYQTTIGRQPETGRLGVTDERAIRVPTVRYTATSGGPCSLTFEFVDAERPLSF